MVEQVRPLVIEGHGHLPAAGTGGEDLRQVPAILGEFPFLAGVLPVLRDRREALIGRTAIQFLRSG